MSSAFRLTLASVARAALLPAVGSAAQGTAYLRHTHGATWRSRGVCVRTSQGPRTAVPSAIRICEETRTEPRRGTEADQARSEAEAAEAPKPQMMNIERKIELQGMPSTRRK